MTKAKKNYSRREFITSSALGICALAVHPSIAQSRATVLEQDLTSGSPLPNQCLNPTISTRLFASSNTGYYPPRNELSLKRLACAGFTIENPEINTRQYLRFAGTDMQRASDLQNIATGAIKAPKLLLGIRGGYGAMRLLELIDWRTLGQVMKDQGTILAGFSDVTAIQCALLALGEMSSLAAPMLYSEFGKATPDQVTCQQFVEALTNPNLKIHIDSPQVQLDKKTAPNQSQAITGVLWGGNLSVVSALAGSQYLPNPEDGIVFLEDVGEQPYKIERMLYSLYLAGAFKNQQAIVLGAFSNTGADSYDARYDLNAVIEQLQRLTGLPVYTGVPFGHVAAKHSLPLGAMCQLTHGEQGLTLEFSDYPVIDRKFINAKALWQ